MYYFVTGATGFIGKRLVRKLLASPDNVVCFLLRDSSRSKLPGLLDYWSSDAAHAIPVSGDMLQDGLGVAADLRAELLGKIDHFFHLAAIYDLRADPAELAAANIDGTRRALALAEALQVRRFHHMSSIAVAGMVQGVFREDMFDEAACLDHPYFATKHAAEAIVRGCRALPWRIYRPGLVVGDSHTGETDKADGPYYFFKAIQRIRGLLPPWCPAIGIEGGRINIVPVDYVVAAAHHIAHLEGLDGQCFHLTDPDTRRVGEILSIFARAAHAPPMSLRVNVAMLKLLPDWLRRGIAVLQPAQRLYHTLMRDLGLPEGILHLLNWPTRFDNRQAAAALSGSGIACPPLEQYANAIWDYWERHLDPALLAGRSLPDKIAGKVVLVTGGSSGIGLASARRLAQAGAVTLICGRDPAKLAAARAQVQACGADLSVYQADLADMDQCDELVRKVLEDHGHVDVLINNAGRSIRRAVDASYDRFHDFQRLMQLNYFGALRVSLGLLPTMAARGAGHVINISSIGVLTNAPRFSAYVASKAALEAWSYCAAAEFADTGVRFTTINMPLVRTPMIAPTAVYRDAPALTPDEAAQFVVRALVEQPARIATDIGMLGLGVQAVAPHLSQVLMNTAYRLSADMDGGAGATPSAEQASAQLQALQHLLRGVHL
ncbi:short-chain dehydrogenase [Massilia sp. WF1]|uniref:SDR family oxidoreductase n=1 Tax=unclassified Massilia TaxID=2609279 RepID=UPI00064ADF5F|nr:MULTISPECIES: SDR family oxidoreductase [unclassified Massilia]ALK97322.1 short-chain dehydrogenase [Massilia sp. WG5]KLU36503.1 short-chain dehydrogenase [Massilia sp. WF1]